MDNDVFMKENEENGARESAIKSLDFKSIFSSPLFLAICILWSVNVFVRFMGELQYYGSFDIEIIGVLFLVGLWIIYGKAKGGSSPLTGMNIVSGTLKAQYIILWICVGALVVCGLIFVGASATLGDSLDGIFAELGIDFDYIIGSVGIDIPESLVFIVIGAGMIGAAIVFIIIDIFCVGKMHAFAKSLCDNEKCGENEIEKAKATKNWLMVCGIFVAISAVFSFYSGDVVSLGTQAATLIVASCFVKKYFVKK